MARPISKTAAGVAGLTAIISQQRGALLAFDFDGVLSPIVDDPQQSQALPGMFSTLVGIGQHVGSIAIITGRPVNFLISRDGFSALRAIPGFMVFGQYGRERWDSASQEVAADPPGKAISAAREELERLLRQPGTIEGAWLEDKGSAVAVHTRRAADPVGALRELSEPVHDVALRHRLRVEPGKLVLELRPDGINKGDVLRKVVEDGRFTSFLYAGDDLGDLSAFAVLDVLRKGGLPGVKVCSGSAEAIEVAQAADVVVDGPAGIAELLTDLRIQIEGRKLAEVSEPR
jgi:trehalose 6-phosphate phosphatase